MMDESQPELRSPADATDAAAPVVHEAPEYLPSLDGLRALGVSMVLAFHVGETFADATDSSVLQLLSRVTAIGPAGVDLFFVLSGFLITGILLAMRGKAGYFRSFYARRTLRIFPLYYTYLALLPVLLASNPASHEALRSYGRNWPWYALYLTNVKMVFFYDRDIGSVQHLWSLAVEEQFYLLWAVVVALLPRRPLALLVGAALVLSPIARGVWMAHGADPIVLYLSSWTHADGLLVGAGIAIARADADFWRGLVKAAPAALVVSLMALLYLHGWLGNAPPADGLYARLFHFTLLATACGGLLALCISSDERGKRPLGLGHRVVRRVGALSYGIYVYHFFLVLRFSSTLHALFGRNALGFAATFLTIALASYALAALSFRWIETPALRLKRYFPRPT